MKQSSFQDRYGARWRRFEAELNGLRKRRGVFAPRSGSKPDAEVLEECEDFPQLYRDICRDLSLAVERRYSPRLVDRLNELALAGHRQLYRRQTDFGAAFLSFVLRDFPARIRRDWLLVAVSSALFFLSGLIIFLFVLSKPEMIYGLMEPHQVTEFESMYDPATRRIGTDRSSESDVMMFGYYIRNNIGIGFRTFASGLLFGVGTAMILVFNGLILGAVSAHIVNVGYQETFFSFVIGHGAFELTGIALIGAAGLKLGLSVIAPGRMSRALSLRTAAAESIHLVYGVAGMLVIAALLEAFWSSKGTIPVEIKYAAGTLLWLLVGAYFCFAGRRRGA